MSAQRDDIEMAAAEAYDPSSKKRKAGNEELVEVDLDVATSLAFGKKEVAEGSPGDVMVTRLSPTHTIEWSADGKGLFMYTIRNAKGQKDSLNDYPAEKMWYFYDRNRWSIDEFWFSNDVQHRATSRGPAVVEQSFVQGNGIFYRLYFKKNGKFVDPTETLLQRLLSAEYGQSLFRNAQVRNVDLFFDSWKVSWRRTFAEFQVTTYQDPGVEHPFDDYTPSNKRFDLAWTLVYERWWNNNTGLDRTPFVGPATILYNVDGTVNREMFFQNGRQISQRDVMKSLFRK